MEKEKKTINVLIVFFISHKSNVKTFLKWILKQCHTALVNMTISLFIKPESGCCFDAWKENCDVQLRRLLTSILTPKPRWYSSCVYLVLQNLDFPVRIEKFNNIPTALHSMCICLLCKWFPSSNLKWMWHLFCINQLLLYVRFIH